MTPYSILLEMKKMLRNLDAWLGKAAAHAETKKYDARNLVQARLAPDMFPLARQVQSACDTAKFAAARLAAKDPPSNPDTEATIPELQARIATTIAYLDSYGEPDLAGAADRSLSLRFFEGKSMNAVDYFIEHAIPNFFFHVTTAYAILRHNGIDLGKRDYIGSLSLR